MSRPALTLSMSLVLASAAAATIVACGTQTDPLAREPAGSIVAQAVNAAKTAPDVTLSGTVPIPGGDLDLTLSRRSGDGCAAKITEPDNGTVDVVVLGQSIWMRPDPGWWTEEQRKATGALGGSEANAMVREFQGKYLKSSTSDVGMADLADLCDVGKLVSEIKLPASAAKGAVTMVDGQRAMPLKGKSGTFGTVYVSDTYAPRVLKVTQADGGSGAVTFTYNSPPIAAPPEGETVDASRFGM